MQQEETFYKTPKTLLEADGYFSPKTGEPVVIRSSEKLIYIYMLDRLKFFVDVLGGQHFESQETIAKKCGLERKSVIRAMVSFVEHGVVQAEKGKPEKGGRERWFYHSINPDLKFWCGSIEKPEPIEKQYSSQSKRGTIKAKKNPVPVQNYLNDEEFDGPF